MVDDESDSAADGGRRKQQPRKTFTSEEDAILLDAMEAVPFIDWHRIARIFNGKQGVQQRTARQLRERWRNYLTSDVNRDAFTPEEDQRLMRLYAEKGPLWKQMARQFQGRTDWSLKNRYRCLTRRAGRANEAAARMAVPAPVSTGDAQGAAVERSAASLFQGFSKSDP
jgi:hypothetical protein